MNRWDLTDAIKNGIGVRIKDWLDYIEANFHILQEEKNYEELDLTDCGINPYQLCEFLKELGFERYNWDDYNWDDNGWEMDYWIYFRRNGFKTYVRGTGIIHELKLVVYFDEDEEDEEE